MTRPGTILTTDDTDGTDAGPRSSMPLGFDPPHPGGMAENSPTFQCWGREFRGAQVPKGRLKPLAIRQCAIRQPSLRDLSGCGRWFPTLKRWAIIGCPSGTKTCPGLAYFVGANPSGIGPRRLALSLSGQLANHREHKERKAGNLGKGGSSPARGWVHFPNRLLLFVLSAFSVVERLRLVSSVPSVPSVVKIFNRPKAMIQEHESTAGISDEETALEQGRFSVGYKL